MSEQCGCIVYPLNKRVEFCPLHAAAPAMLTALEAIMSYSPDAPITHLDNARAAIKLARGGE